MQGHDVLLVADMVWGGAQSDRQHGACNCDGELQYTSMTTLACETVPLRHHSTSPGQHVHGSSQPHTQAIFFMPRGAADLSPLRKVRNSLIYSPSVICLYAARARQGISQALSTRMLQVLLQEVAWDEASRGRKRQARLRAMSQHEGIGDLEHEPLFCAETALKVAGAVSVVLYCTINGEWGDAERRHAPAAPCAQVVTVAT